MRELSSQEKELREEKRNERKFIRETNNIAERLAWVRIKLGLHQSDIVKGTGISSASYSDRECGVMATQPEEYLVLSSFLQGKWALKYKYGGYPKKYGKEVRKITMNWLQLGVDEADENAAAIIEDLKLNIKEKEKEYTIRELEMRRQLELFAEGVEL